MGKKYTNKGKKQKNFNNKKLLIGIIAFLVLLIIIIFISHLF